MLHLGLLSPLLLGATALVLALVVAVLVVRRRIVRDQAAPAPTDPQAFPKVRTWLAAAPDHALALQQMVHEHGQLRARAEASDQALAPLRDRAMRAEQECEQLRQELNRRQDQLKELRQDWEEMTQRVSQVLLELLEKTPDAQ